VQVARDAAQAEPDELEGQEQQFAGERSRLTAPGCASALSSIRDQ
jgi:hypothetical protein